MGASLFALFCFTLELKRLGNVWKQPAGLSIIVTHLVGVLRISNRCAAPSLSTAVTPLEEQPKQYSVTNDIAEGAKCKIGNEDQK
jgi:hypothetical protein